MTFISQFSWETFEPVLQYFECWILELGNTLNSHREFLETSDCNSADESHLKDVGTQTVLLVSQTRNGCSTSYVIDFS